MMKTEQSKQVHRVVAFLDRTHVDYLDKMGKDALFSTGAKFPRTRVIAAMIDLLQKLNLSGDGIRTEQDLEDRLVQHLSDNNRRLALAEGTPPGASAHRGLTGKTEEGRWNEAATRIRG